MANDKLIELDVKFDGNLQSIVLNGTRIGGVKWGDIDNGKTLKLYVNKDAILNELQVIDNTHYIDENKILIALETINEYMATNADDYIYVDACNDCANSIRDVLKESTTSAVHTLTEKEFQDYCAYKLIEKDIKGCLDRERTLETELDRYRNKYGEL